MRIAGIQKNSMVDYPGKLAAVVFTQGCNMKCGYCHNRCLIGRRKQEELIEENDVFSFLTKRKGLLDAVVVSGGEPTLQKDLTDFIGQVKDMGFLLKLDTNGTNPDLVKHLLEKKLVDYVAMDIKAPFCKYKQICGSKADTNSLEESISILCKGLVDYEFRTTYTPELNQSDLVDITRTIRGARRYVLQQYREVDQAGRYTGKEEKRILKLDMNSIILKNVHSMQFRGEFAVV